MWRLMWHVACSGWVAPKDRDSASQLIRYTIAFTVAAKKYLRREAVRPSFQCHFHFQYHNLAKILSSAESCWGRRSETHSF